MALDIAQSLPDRRSRAVATIVFVASLTLLSLAVYLDASPSGIGTHQQLGLDLLIDRHLLVGFGTAVSFLANDEQRKGSSPEQAMDLYSRIGGSIDLPFKPGKGPHAQIQVYGLLGGTLRQLGARENRIRLRDPDCDIALAECAVDSSSSTEWTREFNPLLGGGVRFNLGPASFGFEVGVNPLELERDLRVGGTMGLRF